MTVLKSERRGTFPITSCIHFYRKRKFTWRNMGSSRDMNVSILHSNSVGETNSYLVNRLFISLLT